MSRGTVRISQDATVEILYGGPDEEYISEVDCRLLFVGDQLRQLIYAYKDVVSLFSGSNDLDQLIESLTSSRQIQRFYEVHQENAKVWVVMRDSVFWQQAPTDGLELRLKISNGGRALFHPLPLRRLQALGNLLPLLFRNHTEAEVRLMVKARLSEDDAHWATELLGLLKENSFLERGAQSPNYFFRSNSRPRVTFIGHTSLFLQSEQSAMLMDPILWRRFGLPKSAFDVARMRLGAICCTHSHWDHCNLQTLLLFDKSIPVIIPRIVHPSAFNPPITGVLRMLGFADIREVELWEPIRIDDIELIPVPFYGEQDEPGAEIDHYTYVVRTNGLTLYGGVDCFRDTFGEMRPVLEKVRQMYQPDIAFLPVSKMMYQYKHGGVNGFCRYLDRSLLNERFQYTAGPEDAAEWLAVLNAKWVVPYATFTFSRWATPLAVSRFWKALRPFRLDRCLYPLRPLDSLEPSDLNGVPSSMMRRWTILAWFRIGGIWRVLLRRLQSYRSYRFLRRAVSQYLPSRASRHH